MRFGMRCVSVPDSGVVLNGGAGAERGEGSLRWQLTARRVGAPRSQGPAARAAQEAWGGAGSGGGGGVGRARGASQALIQCRHPCCERGRSGQGRSGLVEGSHACGGRRTGQRRGGGE